MKTVIEMAREAGAGEPESLYGRTDYVVMTKFELERFAEIVRADAIADERERIKQENAPVIASINAHIQTLEEAAIRARGETSLRSNT